MDSFTNEDYWKALILYGLNQATYKIALGKTLLSLSEKNYTRVSWDDLSKEFFSQYYQRLTKGDPMPQQSIPSRRTRMEQIVAANPAGITDTAIAEVGATAFGDVIHRFHNLAGMGELHGRFYTYEFGKYLELTDAIHKIRETSKNELEDELDARWSLLEGAFSIGAENYVLSNDIRLIYIENGYKRKPLTDNIPFLQGYQGNTCFYCAEPIANGDVHVDHVLPRQVILHDEIWNLVLSHSLCNEQKSDRLVGQHFLEKLIARNENIMGSNHPWKRKIAEALGVTPEQRASSLRVHYENMKAVLGNSYWGGVESYNPGTDEFYRRLITVLNNR
jgi:hypothetical protein